MHFIYTEKFIQAYACEGKHKHNQVKWKIIKIETTLNRFLYILIVHN